MTLTQVIEKLKQNLRLLVGGFLLFFFIVLGIVIFLRLQPKPYQASFGILENPKITPLSTVGRLRVSFEGSLKEWKFPKVGEVYRLEVPKEEEIYALAENFGFAPPGEARVDIYGNSVLYFSGERKALGVSFAGNLSFAVADDSLKFAEGFGDSSQVEEAAKQVLDQFKLSYGGTAPRVKFFEIFEEGFTEASDFAQANLLEATFTQTFGGFPVSYDNYLNYRAKVVFREDGSLRELEYHFWEKRDSSSYPLKNFNQAKTALENGEGVLVFAGGFSDLPFVVSPLRLSQIRVTSAELGYFKEGGVGGFLHPVYIFRGKGVKSAGEEIEVVTFLPAVDSRYLKE